MKSLKPFYPDFLLARVISQANHQRKQSKAVTIIQKRSFWAIKKHLKNHPHKNIYISGDRYRLLKQIEMAIVLYFCNLDPPPPIWQKLDRLEKNPGPVPADWFIQNKAYIMVDWFKT